MQTIRLFVFLFSFLFVSNLSYGQNLTNSPYSAYGLGMAETSGYVRAISMGGVKYGIHSATSVNISNPASYAFLTTPTFEIGLVLNSLTHYSNPQQKLGTGYFKNMSMGFRVSKRWGLSFGIVPLQKVGYSINSSILKNEASIGTSSYTGRGSLNAVYLGNAFKIISDSSNVLSLGVNAKYLFGTIQKTRRLVPTSAAGFYNTNNIDRAIFKGASFDFGLMYERKLTKKYSINFGANMTYQDSLSSKRNGLTTSFTGNIATASTKDVIASTTFNTKAFIPAKYGFGLSLVSQQLVIGVDYSFQKLNNLYVFSHKTDSSTRNQLSIGAEFTPDNTAVSTFYKIVNYRLGVRTTNLGYKINGADLKEFAFNFGFGMPLVKSASKSVFSIGLEIGQRGNENKGQIKEQFTNIYIGFSITPHKFDGWFRKRKIN